MEYYWKLRGCKGPRPFAVLLEQTGKLVPLRSVIQLTFQ